MTASRHSSRLGITSSQNKRQFDSPGQSGPHTIPKLHGSRCGLQCFQAILPKELQLTRRCQRSRRIALPPGLHFTSLALLCANDPARKGNLAGEPQETSDISTAAHRECAAENAGNWDAYHSRLHLHRAHGAAQPASRNPIMFASRFIS